MIGSPVGIAWMDKGKPREGLLGRSTGVDSLVYPHCVGPIRIGVLIERPEIIENVLTHLRL